MSDEPVWRKGTKEEVILSGFPDNPLAGEVLSMEPTADGVVATATRLLKAEEVLLTQSVTRPFVEGLFQLLLNWMASGEIEETRRLLGALRSELCRPDWVNAAHDTPSRLRLIFALDAAGHLLATFLRTDNLTKYVGILSGVRRRSWRDALCLLLSREQAMMRRDFVAAKVFDNDKTAHAALQRLVKAGLVSRSRHQGNVLYELSWPGKSVARGLTANAKLEDTIGHPVKSGDAPVRTGILVPFRRPNHTQPQETPDDSLLWDQSSTCRFAVEREFRELAGDYLLAAGHVKGQPWAQDFQNCGTQHGGDAFYPAWQEAMRLELGEVLTRIGQGHGHKKVKHQRLQAQPHIYPYIESLIRRGQLALPLEMIFGDIDRAGQIDVVRLARVTSFRAVFVADSKIAKKLRWQDGRSVEAVLDRLREANAKICTPLDTAAQHHVWNSVTFWSLQAERAGQSEATVKGLGEWLAASPDEGVIVCDTGVALSVLADAVESRHAVGELASVRAEYNQPIPAGIAFSRSDVTWGRLLAALVAKSLQSSDPTVRQSWDLTKRACQALDMTWSPDGPVGEETVDAGIQARRA